MFSRIRNNVVWHVVRKLAAQGRIDDALAKLDGAPVKYRTRISFDVLRLSLEAARRNGQLVIDQTPALLARIEREKPDDNDRRYVIAFVKTTERIAYETLSEAGAIAVPKDLDVNWRSIDLRAVPGRPRWEFPLRRHPDWREGDR